MDYASALAWWHERVDYERKQPKPGELSLDRMRALMRKLGDPHEQLRIVHIAGSKGKGSTAAMFEAVGRAAGLKVGLYTSPHLSDPRERIQINRQLIAPDDLTKLLCTIRDISDDDPPTFFEIATAAGYLHFAQVGVDLAVIEVGLGGRFDATNICTPILSVITSISLEHTAILGDRLEQIAFEKGGIIKSGVPVVSGVTAPAAAEVIAQLANERRCPLMQLPRDMNHEYVPGRITSSGQVEPSKVIICRPARSPLACDVNLLGAHQAANATLVAVGAGVLNDRGLRVSDDAIAQGLRTVDWPARFEVFAGPPLTVLDCAHNVDSAQSLVDTLAELHPNQPRTLIFSCATDKDAAGMLRVLLASCQNVIFTRFQSNPRATSSDELCQIARRIRPDVPATATDEPAIALTNARLTANAIVICGSVYLAGELRSYLI